MESAPSVPVPWHATAGTYWGRLSPSFEAYLEESGILLIFIKHSIDFFRCESALLLEKEKKILNMVFCAHFLSLTLDGLNCTAPMALLLASVSGDTMSADSTANLQSSSSTLLEWSGDYHTGKYFAELAGLGLQLLILWQRRTSLWGAVNLFFCWC